MAGDVSAPRSPLARLSPLTLSQVSVAFALIAALWLAVATVRGEVIALIAALAVVLCGHAGRVLAGERASAPVEWGLAAGGLLAEFAVYASIASAASLHIVLPPGVTGTLAGGLGGPGSAGGWRLAVVAVIIAAVNAMTDICVNGPARPGARLRLFGPPGDLRLPVTCLVVVLAGTRAGLLVAVILGAAALLATVVEGTRGQTDRGELRGYRGDGPVAVWLGRWVDGRVPPLPLLFVGLLVTGVLVALGLRNLSGILLLTPAEAMLLAAFASRHPHDGRSDWLVPPLLHTGEYVFLAGLGFAGHVWPPLTLAVVAAAGLRHLDLAYRVRGGLAAGLDRRGLGWEGRMILAAIATAVGIAPATYVFLGLYLWYRVGRDWAVGWSARYAVIGRQ